MSHSLLSFLPIVERELRQASRKPSIYRARLLVSVAASLLAALLLLTLGWGSSRFIGGSFFRVLFFIAFFYCVWEGGRNTADCISEEKRGGTLGLLFLTNLRGADVVLGKLAAGSTRAFHGLLGFFPVLSMSLVLGGITAGEFWRAVLVLMNTFVFGLAAGLLVSSIVRSGGMALASTIGALVIANVLPFALLPGMKGYPWIWAWSPATGARLLWEADYLTHKSAFWVSQLLVALSSLFAIGVASAIIGRAWQEKTISPRRAFKRQRFASSAARRHLRDLNPVCWLATHDASPYFRNGFYASIVILFVAISLFAQLSLAGVEGTAALALGLKLWVAFEASFRLAEARQSGALELVASTPLNSGELARGYHLGLIHLFRWPVIALICCYLAVSYIARLSPAGAGLWQQMFFPAQAFLWAARLVLDIFAIGFVGLWCGLTAAKPVAAFGKTILLAMVLPAIAVCIPNILIDLVIIGIARPKLQKEFRDLMIGMIRVARGLVPWPATSGHGAPPIIVRR